MICVIENSENKEDGEWNVLFLTILAKATYSRLSLFYLKENVHPNFTLKLNHLKLFLQSPFQKEIYINWATSFEVDLESWSK